MPSFKIASSAIAFTLASRVLAQTCGTCQSFGVDFYSGGTFFQNSLSTDPFTAVQEFEGCANDTSHNVLVDPNGDQYQCSMTPMTPDDTPETITCPLDKDQLYSGEWSLQNPLQQWQLRPNRLRARLFSICWPAADSHRRTNPDRLDHYHTRRKRHSDLHANDHIHRKSKHNNGSPAQPPADIDHSASPGYHSSHKGHRDPHLHIQDPQHSRHVNQERQPQRRQRPDPVASIVATVLADLGLAIGIKERDAIPAPTARPRSAMTEFKRAIIEGRAVEPKLKARWIEERHAALALEKRAPDQPTITITAANSAAATDTITSTAPTVTVTGTTTSVQTVVTTPTVTVSKGIAFGIVTVTGSKRTLTNTFFVPATTVFKTTTVAATLTITSTTTPAALAASCSNQGGHLA
ncbi:hypothetical protein LTR91_018859 [Friedmanniomyces endolithicus]|uniref:Uncharacterized protein n=1 Tax=Friedmanniomyces endolithicus TaxID=329885 RepID=A0AAN6K2P2_9PEZI|nr:hypothetical protein LTR57_016401 [Friedmanniomyces endolithicus]KAK0961877.1 hypothetical protein LTS01_020111 [Friedmanniomyces endolithicus]KAK0963685.1 hypothetical protein LTR91_018859 [Friedmanniomyces endolithicus]KAK1033086.1 hypothetical protein LTS16_016631 [Friedmanniomyces endolithicus]